VCGQAGRARGRTGGVQLLTSRPALAPPEGRTAPTSSTSASSWLRWAAAAGGGAVVGLEYQCSAATLCRRGAGGGGTTVAATAPARWPPSEHQQQTSPVRTRYVLPLLSSLLSTVKMIAALARARILARFCMSVWIAYFHCNLSLSLFASCVFCVVLKVLRVFIRLMHNAFSVWDATCWRNKINNNNNNNNNNNHKKRRNQQKNQSSIYIAYSLWGLLVVLLCDSVLQLVRFPQKNWSHHFRRVLVRSSKVVAGDRVRACSLKVRRTQAPRAAKHTHRQRTPPQVWLEASIWTSKAWHEVSYNPPEPVQWFSDVHPRIFSAVTAHHFYSRHSGTRHTHDLTDHGKLSPDYVSAYRVATKTGE